MRKPRTVRFDEDLMVLLDAAAEQKGHSFAEEVRRRLWKSFDSSPHGFRYEQAWLSP